MRLRLLIISAMLSLVLTADAVGTRYSCTKNLTESLLGARTRGFLGYPSQQWNPQRIYRVPVILITFKDQDFRSSDPVAYYQRVLNESGYNEGAGIGSAADYYRDQSGGRFNLQFDVFGPIKVDTVVKGNGSDNYGDYAIRMATRQLANAAEVDFTPYDWDGDGYADQTLYIAAGICGNDGKEGQIWPNTGNVSSILMPGSVRVSKYSISGELWADGSPCGIGTICHEFAHCLGLPDLYPTNGVSFSAVDDWDLMDGGNYTGKGWCPPNFSALEKMLLGWDSPKELSEAVRVSDMRSVADGGVTYMVRNDGYGEEYFILENRQWKGWDYGLPGQGLLIVHVDFDAEAWSSNNVNNVKGHYRYGIMHADGLDYDAWEALVEQRGWGVYAMEDHLHRRYLSTSAYPWSTDSTTFVNSDFADDSQPAATLFHANSVGTKLLSRPITNILVSEEGVVSFDFMWPASSVQGAEASLAEPVAWYDLRGRQLPEKPSKRGIYIVHYADGTIRKAIR